MIHLFLGGKLIQKKSMNNLTELAEKLNEKFAGKIPYFNCIFSDNLCDSVVIRLSLEKKENWKYNIFHNSPFLICHIFASDQREETSNPEKYLAEYSACGMSPETKKLRKKTGNLNQIFSHLEKYFEYLIDSGK